MRSQYFFVFFAALTCCGPADGETGSGLSSPANRSLAASQTRAPQAQAWDQLTTALTQGDGEAIFTFAPDLAAEGVPGAGNVLLLVVGDSRGLCARLSPPQSPQAADDSAQAAGQGGVQLALWLREVDATGQAHFPSPGSFEVDPAGGARPWAAAWWGFQPGAMLPGRHAVARLLAPPTTPGVAPRAGCRPCAAAAAAVAKQRPQPPPSPTGRLALSYRQVSDTSETPAALQIRLSLSPVGPQAGRFAETFAASWCPGLSLAPVPPAGPAP